MKKGIALWFLAFAAYGTALLFFLIGLERLFIAERDDARADLAAQRRALEKYAEQSLRQSLRERLDLTDPEFDRAARDPFVDDASLRLIVDGELVLPRIPAPLADGDREPSARDFYATVRADAGQFRSIELATDDPLRQRLELLGKVMSASELCRPQELAEATQRLLTEESLYRLSTGVSAVLGLVLVESLMRCESVNPQLLQGLLRDGLPMVGGGTSDGLQRTILKGRGRLTAADLQFLCEKTSALSARLSIDDTDFKLRCKSQVSFEGWPRTFEEGDLLEPSWLMRTRGSVTRGVRVDVPAMLEAIRTEMVERGLLEWGDTLSAASAIATPLDALRLGLSSPSLAEFERRADRRLTAKSGLLVAFAALAVALAVGAVVSQRRKQRYLELKSDFVAAVSHELRTPLASLRVMAETLEHRLEGEAKARDYPRRIVAEADALSGLVENILSFNRLDKGRWVAHRRPLALAEFQKALEEEARAYGLAQVEVSFEGFADERVEADPELLKLLFSNLLRNACRYNANDPVRVRFAATRAGNALSIRAFDNGVGIPVEARDEVFEEFKRLKGQPGRGGPGSGLGLSLCRRIMGLHGGTLSLEASSSSGSTFLMHFPNA